ncbi:MAG TPA: hypothetical protein VD978_30080 [Azospirillum sp.]|nr:hypothetical protein [Azospirillum sp.]
MSKTVTVAVPVILHVTVRVPSGAAVDAEAIATCAAEHFAHVSHAEIAAFNEVNRIHPEAPGAVDAVSATVERPRKAAA